MTESKKLVVGLLSHYLEDANLGCVALSVSNIALMDEIAGRSGFDLEYRFLVTDKYGKVAPALSSTAYEYRFFPSSKQTLRHPIRYIKSDVFDGCDLVVNINAGDGFTDLYSFGRMLSESYMLLLAQRNKVPTVMAPQTIGPFDHRLSRRIARRVLRGCSAVFSRDGLSTTLANELLGEPSAVEVIDVAFALPFERIDLPPYPDGQLQVGINVSGLLYRGGYDGRNYFGLAVDYRDFVHRLVERMQNDGHRVHLIAHVTPSAESIEDDYSACREVAAVFPDAILAPRFTDPVAVKSYIASLDFFTGARMHSTIAAFSAGVPVAPIGYSKKLNGLYDTLGYPYYIDLREASWTTATAVQTLVDWMGDLPELQQGIASGRHVFERRLEFYKANLATVMGDCAGLR